MLAQGIADIAQPLHGEAQALEVRALVIVPDGGLDRHQHAVGRHRQRLLGCGRGAGGVARDLAHDGKIGQRGADIVGRDVAAALALDHAAHGAEQLGRLVAARVGQHHRLAAAIGQLADGGLVGHAPRQPQRIGQSLGRVGVRVHPAAAEGRAEPGVVQRHDGLQAGRRVVRMEHGLVAVILRVREHPALPAEARSPTPGCRDRPAGRRSPRWRR